MPLAASPLQLTPAEHRPLGAVATSGDGYVPGVCNIGPEEIRRRRASSMVAFGVAAAGLAMLIALGAPHPVRLVLLLPLWGGTFSWLQARRRFCGGFAVS